MSARIRGLTIEIEGNTTKLTDALRDVETKTRSMKTGLRDVNRLLKFDPTNTDLLKQKQEMLKTAISSSKDKLKELNRAMEEMKKNDGFDENSEDAQRLKREIIATEQEIKKLESELSRSASVMGMKMEAVGAKVSEAGKKMSAVGSSLTQKVTLPVALAAGAAVKSFAEVDKTMTLTNQTMGNTTAEAKELSDAMKDAASNSTFGMTDAANASLNFARAGLDASQAANTLAPAMNLAAGEGGDLDKVSQGLVATINGFHDSFDDAAKYADVFANACNNSALDIDGLSEAMSVAAPVFAAAGYKVEDAALYMGVMANNGIDAGKAANSLKTGLSRLVKPAKEGQVWMEKLGISMTDQNGVMKDTTTIQQELHDAFGKLSESEQIAAASAIFGKNQMAPWLALINSAPDDVAKLSNELKVQGTTTEMAQAMMEGFGGSLEKLKSSIDVAKTSFGEALAPTISLIADKIQAAVDKFNSLSDEEKEHIAQMALFAAAAGPVLLIVGKLTTGVGNLISVIGKGLNKIAGLSEGLAFLSTGPAVAAIAAIGALVGGAVLYSKHLQKERDELYRLNEAEQANTDQLNKSTKAYEDACKQRDEAVKNISEEYGYINKLKDEYNGLIDSNGKVKEGYEARADFILGELSQSLGIEKDKILELRDANGQLGASIDEVIQKKQAQAYLDANYDAYKEAIKLQSENTKALAQDIQALAEAEEVAMQKKKEYTDFQARCNAITADGGRVSGEMSLKLQGLKGDYEAASGKVDKLKKSVEGYKDASADATSQINEYESLQKAVTEENYGAIAEILENSRLDLKSHGEATTEELNKQAEQAYKDYQTIKKQYEHGEEGITEAMVEWAEARSKQADKEAGIMREKAGNAGKSQATQYGKGLEGKTDEVNKKGIKVLQSALSGLLDVKGEFGKKGSKGSADYSAGLGANQRSVGNAAAGLRDTAVSNADTGSSGYTLGDNFGSGFAAGIGGWLRNVGIAAANLGIQAVNSLAAAQQSHSPSKATQKLGKYFGEGYAEGIMTTRSMAAQAADAMTRAALTSAGMSQLTNPLSFLNSSSGLPGSGSSNALTQYNTIEIKVNSDNPTEIVDRIADELQLRARMA